MDLQKRTLRTVNKAIKQLSREGHPHAPLLITLASWVDTAGKVGVDELVVTKARGALLTLADKALRKA